MNPGLQYREGPAGWADYIGDRVVRAGDRLTLYLDDGTRVSGRYEVALHRPDMGADRQPVLHVQAQCAEHPGEPNPCACEGTVAVIPLHPLMVVRHAEPQP